MGVRKAPYLHLANIGRIFGVAVVMAHHRQSHAVATTATNASCLDTWKSANARGLQPFLSPQISALEKTTRGGPGNDNLDWALTLNAPGASEGPRQFENVVWLGTPPDVNLNDGNNPFSACAMLFTDLPQNTVERGQSDDGSCTQTFDNNCVSALTTQAAAIAQSLTADCTPGANSNCSIADICPTIFSKLGTQDGFISECVPYFNIGNNQQSWPSANVTAISSNEGDDSQEVCAIRPFQIKTTFVPTFNLTNSLRSANGNQVHDSQLYNNLTTAVYPILSIFMPPANGTRTSAFQDATAQMSCLRATNFSSGSVKPSPLPKPTPVVVPSQDGGLSSGAIAGIAVGCVAFVALVLAAAWYVWRRRRIAKDRAEAVRWAHMPDTPMTSRMPSSTRSGNPFASQSRSFTSDPSGFSNELPPDSTIPPKSPEPVELPPDSFARPVEMNAAPTPTEVPAHEARVRQSLASPTADTPMGEHMDTLNPFENGAHDDVSNESPLSIYPETPDLEHPGAATTQYAEMPVTANLAERSGRTSAAGSLPPPPPWRNPARASNRGWMTPANCPPTEEEPHSP